MIRRVDTTVYHHPLIKKVKETIEKHSLLTPNEKVLVGLSGGADSVALLISLSICGYPCVALHCNFHLRGEDSNQDASFCKALCARYSIPLSVCSFDTKLHAEREKISIEMAARNLRYTAFQEEIKKHSIKKIAVAHHLQDNVETLLGNIALGSGIKGLKGIPIRRDNIIRPFLEIDPKHIYSFLEVLGEKYCIDHTNQDTSIRRNYIRHSILPHFDHLNPNFLEATQRLFENLREVQKLYIQRVESILQEAYIASKDETTEVYLCEPIATSQAPLAILHEILSSKGFTRNELEKFAYRLTEKESATIYSPTHQVTRSYGRIFISSREDTFQSIPPLTLELTERSGECNTPYGTIRYTFCEQAPVQKGKNIALIDVSAYSFPPQGTLSLHLALPELSSKIRPLGLRGQKEIKKILREQKLTERERKRVPLLTLEAIPLWLMPYTRTDALLVKETTTQILVLEVV